MRLDAFLEEFERDEAAERRQLAKERSYAITDYLEDFEARFESITSGDALFGSTAPSIFVGHANYPSVPTGLLSPVGNEDEAASFVTDRSWYDQHLDIAEVFRRRSGLLTANRSMEVTAPARVGRFGPKVHDVWDGFLGVQREVAVADRPVDVEIGLAERPTLEVTPDTVAEPRGPWARAKSADLTENPSVPLEVEKTISDDDWRAEGAMTYLYRRDFDVYDIHRILSAGALGEARERRLVPTRWSITAVDDTVGKYLRGRIHSKEPIDGVEVWQNDFIGNYYWVILAPGEWEYELVELKGAGSVWNPNPEDDIYIAADYEGYEGRTGYVEQTAGAYHAARLGVLEHLAAREQQAKALVIRNVTDEYWGPVGVWQVRESVRNAFEGERGRAPTMKQAIESICTVLPITAGTLGRASTLVAGQQASLTAFD